MNQKAGAPKNFHAGGMIMIYKRTFPKESAGLDLGIQIYKPGINIINKDKIANKTLCQKILKLISGRGRFMTCQI